jgi:hypothetical protein
MAAWVVTSTPLTPTVIVLPDVALEQSSNHTPELSVDDHEHGDGFDESTDIPIPVGFEHDAFDQLLLSIPGSPDHHTPNDLPIDQLSDLASEADPEPVIDAHAVIFELL